MNIELRPANPDDAQAIVQIFRSAFDFAERERMVLGCVGADQYVMRQIYAERFGGESSYWVAMATSQAPVGFIEMKHANGELFLNYIAVKGSYRSAGVGKQLLRCTLDKFAEEFSRVYLDVNLDNSGARAWYERLGFEVEEQFDHWSVSLKPDGQPANAVVRGMAQASLLQDTFGFSQFNVQTVEAEHQVGILGKRWFRVADQIALYDRELVNTLYSMDSERRMLISIPESGDVDISDSDSQLIARTVRMVASIQSVLRHLSV